MRLKQRPGDFRVWELYRFQAAKDGRHYVHVLRKTKLSTHEAIDRIVRRLGVDRRALAYAGLKDRQGITEQYVSVEGRRLALAEPDLSLRFVGRSRSKVSSKDSAGNRFRIVVRDLSAAELRAFERNLPVVERLGLPNYFDDQRFHCLAGGTGLVFVEIARGDFEGALKRLLATPDRRPRVRASKAGRMPLLLARHWGDWDAILSFARGPLYQGVFGHLREHPGDFRGALLRLPLRQRTLHLFAFQAYVWNRAVARWLGALLGGRRPRLGSRTGPLPVWDARDAALLARLPAPAPPLPGPFTQAPDPLLQRALERELQALGLDFAALDLDLEGFRPVEEERPLVLQPRDLAVEGPARDERNRGRSKLTLRFALPRGAYATLLIKRLFAGGGRCSRGGDQPPPRSGRFSGERTSPKG